MKAVVDSNEHEQHSEIKKLLEANGVEDVKVHPLDAADIVIEGVGFERKTPSDFASSIQEGRLQEQRRKLNQAYEHSYVLLEGRFQEFYNLDETKMNPSSMYGMAASLTARYGIPVIPTADLIELVTYAIKLARKHTEEPVSSHLEVSSVDTAEPPGKRMWACAEGVGPELAERLWDEFGSPMSQAHLIRENFIDNLQRLEGIGEKRAKNIHDDLWGFEP